MSGIAGQTVYRFAFPSPGGAPLFTYAFSQIPPGDDESRRRELGRWLEEERIVALLELVAASRALQVAMDAYNDAEGESFDAENACALALANHQAALARVEAVAS